jgi:hypothetical protein
MPAVLALRAFGLKNPSEKGNALNMNTKITSRFPLATLLEFSNVIL